MSNANKTQVGGNHYQSGYQHWDFVRQCLDGRYLEGCLTKYVSRWRKKNGLQDLQKGKHYLEKLREEFRLGNVQPLRFFKSTTDSTSTAAFCDHNGLQHRERDIVNTICCWANASDLGYVAMWLDNLIEEATDVEQAKRIHHRGPKLRLAERVDNCSDGMVVYFQVELTDAQAEEFVEYMTTSYPPGL